MTTDLRHLLDGWRRILAGEASSAERSSTLQGLEALFAAEEPRVAATCERLLEDAATARRVAEQLATTAWRSLHELEDLDRQAFSLWMSQLTLDLCTQALRSRPDPLVEDGVTTRRLADRSRWLKQASDDLSPAAQEIAYARYVLRLPVEAIARSFGRSTDDVAAALRDLRDAWKGHSVEEP
ncbi:MAG: hypothetical protein KTR31_07945 [Myxococcales bacterium]|nr:hypothetical protein [Myxococcales bacterium]